MNKQELADIWEEATTLPDGQPRNESPLTMAIFQEALEASEPQHSPQDVVKALYAVAGSGSV